jgi:hypothetical protein
MKVNGNITIVEGGVVHNLTLPSSPTFPENGSRGELFSLAGHADPTTWPDGFYHHDGTTWKHVPNLTKVQELIAAALGGVAARFRPVLNVSTLVGAQGIGSYWAMPNVVVLSITGTLTTIPLNLFYYDPADYPAGTKFRITAAYSQNNSPTATIDFTIGLRKVGKPSTTGGTGTQMIYLADASDVANVVQAGGIGSKAMGRIVSAEFEMPNVAGHYGFVITLSNTNSNAGTHWDLTLQAKL